MKELIILGTLYIVFIIISFCFYNKMISVKKGYFIILILIYVLFIYFYYDGFDLIHGLLREKGIYLEFGHASEAIVLLFMLSLVTGIVIIYAAFLKRYKQNKINNKI